MDSIEVKFNSDEEIKKLELELEKYKKSNYRLATMCCVLESCIEGNDSRNIESWERWGLDNEQL